MPPRFWADSTLARGNLKTQINGFIGQKSQIYTHTCGYTRTQARTHNARAHTQVCIRTRARTHTRTHTRTRTRDGHPITY